MMNSNYPSKNKTALITGGSGFIGANVYQYFSDLGMYNEIFIQIRENSDLWRYKAIGMNPKIIINNLDEIEFWKVFLIENNVTDVYHLAASGGFTSQDNQNEIFNLNLYSSVKFLSACIQSGVVKHFISTGTSSEYGIQDSIVSENAIASPYSDYGWSKLIFGLAGQKLSENSNLLFYHLRLYTIYGELEHPSRFIPRLLTFAKDGLYPELSNKNISKDYVYIKDLLSLLHLIIQSETKIGTALNVSSGISVRHEQLVSVIKEIFSIPSSPRWGNFPSRSFDHHIWSGSPELADKSLMWNRLFSLTEGLESTIKGIDNLNLWRFYKDNMFNLPR